MKYRVNAPFILLLFATAVFFGVTLAFSLTRFYQLKTSGYDGAILVQLLNNVLQGHGLIYSLGWPQDTMAAPDRIIHYFSLHFIPAFYALVPIYYLFPRPETLYVVNALLMASAAIPIFFAARNLLRSHWQALCISLFFLINPYVINATFWDFSGFAPFFLALTFWALTEKRKLFFCLSLLALLCLKEHYGIAIFGFGIVWAWHWKEWQFGLSIAAAGLVSFAIILGVIMPFFAPLNAAAMFSEQSSIDRYSWLLAPFSNMDIVHYIFFTGLFYALGLLFPLWFIPLLAFVWLLPAAADMAANILALPEMPRENASYHTAPVIPVILIAYCAALARMKLSPKLRPIEVIAASAIFCVFLSFSKTALPISTENDLWEFSSPQLHYREEDSNALAEIHALIPVEAIVSAQNNILPHLAPRVRMYHFPEHVDDAEYIVLYTGFPYQRHYKVFGSPYSAPGPQYFDRAFNVLKDTAWGVIYYHSDWLVLKRNASDAVDLRTLANEKLQKTQQHYLRMKSLNNYNP